MGIRDRPLAFRIARDWMKALQHPTPGVSFVVSHSQLRLDCSLSAADLRIREGVVNEFSTKKDVPNTSLPRTNKVNRLTDSLGEFLFEKNRGDADKPPAPPGQLNSWDRSFLVMQSAS